MSIPPYVDKNFYVKVTESSMSDTILPSVLLGDFQESAEDGVMIFDIDNDIFNDRGYCWIVLRMSVELDRLPKWKENFTIRTWSCGTQGLFWRRDYKLLDTNGEVFGRSTSDWIVADIESHRPIRPRTMISTFEDVPNAKYLGDSQNDDRSLDYSAPKLEFPDDLSSIGVAVITKYADYSELDHNHHVNNTRYVAWAFDALFKKGIDVDVIKSFDINYHSEVKQGERVDIFMEDSNNSYMIYGYKNGSEKVFVFRANLSNL